MKKTLAFQLDRLDSILDGLAEALNGAVAVAVKESVGAAAKEAVKVALEEAIAQAAVEQPKAAVNPVIQPRNQMWAKVSSIVTQLKNVVTTRFQQLKQWFARSTSATVEAVQSGVATIKSRSIRMGVVLGTIVSCGVSLFRKEAKVFWWGAGIVVCTMLLESCLGTLGTLMLGGSLIYLTAQTRAHLATGRGSIPPTV